MQLLDLLVEFAAERLLVLDLAGERAELLLLALHHLRQLHLHPLQVGNSLLGQLQVPLSLQPPGDDKVRDSVSTKYRVSHLSVQQGSVGRLNRKILGWGFGLKNELRSR